jgi:hypothetical protein
MVTSTVETIMGMPASKAIMEMRIKGKRILWESCVCVKEGDTRKMITRKQ